MANTGLDMQVSRNTNGAIAILEKAQDKSSIGSQHGQSTPFFNILGEKAAQATSRDCDIETIAVESDHGEKIVGESDDVTTYAGFEAIPAPVLIPSGLTYQLLKESPHSVNKDGRSLPLMDKAQLAMLSLPHVNGTGDLTEKLEKNSLSSSDEANSSVLSNPDGGKTENHLETSLKQTIQVNMDEISQSKQTQGKTEPFTMALALEADGYSDNEFDQSATIPDIKPPVATSRHNATSTISLTTKTAGQADQVVANNIVHEAVSAATDVTIGNLPQMTDRIRAEKSKQQSEKNGPSVRIAERLQQKEDNQTVDGLFSDIRRTTGSRDNTTRAAMQRDRAYHYSTAIQKPTTVANDGVVAIGPSPSEGLSQDTLTDKAVFMKTAPAGITTQDRDDQQKSNTASDRFLRTVNRDEIPFHTEISNIQSTRGNLSTSSNGPAGINTQAVIDQIMDAKQSLNNGFGRVRITLDPPNLGTVNLEIVIRKERVEVVMTADNAGVQQALQSRAEDIRTALQRQDLKIETFQVLLQENTANHQQTNSGSTFGQHQENHARQNLLSDNAPIQSLSEPIRDFKPTKGLVSIFA